MLTQKTGGTDFQKEGLANLYIHQNSARMHIKNPTPTHPTTPRINYGMLQLFKLVFLSRVGIDVKKHTLFTKLCIKYLDRVKNAFSENFSKNPAGKIYKRVC